MILLNNTIITILTQILSQIWTVTIAAITQIQTTVIIIHHLPIIITITIIIIIIVDQISQTNSTNTKKTAVVHGNRTTRTVVQKQSTIIIIIRKVAHQRIKVTVPVTTLTIIIRVTTPAHRISDR